MIEALAIALAASVWSLGVSIRHWALHSAAKRRVAKWKFPPLRTVAAREGDDIPW